MTFTRAAVRAELYNQVPGLGFTGTADSITTTTLTDTFALEDTTLTSNTYRGYYIYRPSFNTDDRVKRATTLVLATGVLSHGGSNYSNTTTLDYEVVGKLHPDELNACITRAMTRVYFETQVPLTGTSPDGITDGDMDASTTASWTASSGSITLSKVTTIAKVWTGIRALRALSAATNEYAESERVRVIPTIDWVYASAVVHADVGTAGLIVYDKTQSAVIGSAITSGEEGFAHLWLHTQIPAGCEEITLRLRGSESNADCYWNHALLYKMARTSYVAPSWLDEQYKFLKLREAKYMSPISNQTNGGYDDATSRRLEDWLQPSMFSLDPFNVETNPFKVQLHRATPRNELWVEGKRPYSDLEPLTASDTSTTHAPFNQVVAYSKLELAKVLKKRYPTDKAWDMLLLEATADTDAETRSRPEIPLQLMRRNEYMGSV